MKKATVLLLTFMLLCGQASALMAFTTDGEIKDGDTFDYVQAFNNATVNITGGSVTVGFAVFGRNTINVTGGYIAGLGTNSGSEAVFNISTGANIGGLTIGEFAKGYISGGVIGTMNISSSSGTADITGGNITNYLKVSGTANIYGYGFNYNPLAGAYNGGQLTGFWLDGGAFSIDLKNYGGGDLPVGITYDNLNLVPEPITLALFGFGGLLLRRRK